MRIKKKDFFIIKYSKNEEVLMPQNDYRRHSKKQELTVKISVA